jgi:hypothetical protein
VAARRPVRLAEHIAGRHLLVLGARALQLDALVRLGQTELAEQALADLGEPERDRGQIHIATAVLRLAQDDTHAAARQPPVTPGRRLTQDCPIRKGRARYGMILSGLLLEGRDVAIADWGICYRAVAERA